MPRLREIFANRRVGIQLPLGYASGLPLLLTGGTLNAWMKTRGVDLTTIGVFGLVGLSYNLKFLWAPLLDRYPMPLLGRRRGWLLVFQLMTMIALWALSTIDAGASPARTAIVAVVVAFFSASQDVVVDGYRADLLRPEERASGVAVFITGYRLGMIVAGAVALYIVERVGWSFVYQGAALTMLIGMVATVFAPEPEHSGGAPRNLADAFFRPLADLLSRRGSFAILALVLLYRFGYSAAQPMSTPFLQELHFSLKEIGLVQKGVGLGATLIGGLCAGASVSRLGMRRALLLFGATQALIHMAWIGLYYTGPNNSMLALTVFVENFFMSLATTAFDAYLMALCNSSFSATQFAVLSSMTSLGGRLLGASSGVLAKSLGWPMFFFATSLAAIPSLLVLAFALPKILDPAEAEDKAANAGAGTTSQ